MIISVTLYGIWWYYNVYFRIDSSDVVEDLLEGLNDGTKKSMSIKH